MVLLGLLIVIAYVWPLIGVAGLLVLCCSLFNLQQYATVALPLGYIQPTEAVLAAIICRLLIDRWGRPLQRHFELRYRYLAWAILPYVVWQAVCCVRGAIIWQGTEHLRYALRFLLTGVLPWCLPLVLVHYYERVPRLLAKAFWIAIATAAAHAAIQILDYRQIMVAAYVPPISEGNEFTFVTEGMRYWIEHASFVRFQPQGVLLILFFALFAACFYMLGGKKKPARELLLISVLTLATVICLSRSLLFSLITGFAAALFLALCFGVFRASPARLAAGATGAVAALAICASLSPGFIATWQQRIDELAGVDSQIFSEQNEARGRDNLASLHVLRDHPFMGLGTSRYPQEYSLRLEPPTDTHPMLVVGTVGGIPAMVLLVRLQWMLVIGLVREMRRDRRLARPLVPYLTVLGVNAFVVNMIGAGGSIAENGLLAATIFISGAWSVCISAAARRKAQQQEEERIEGETAYIDSDTVLQPGLLH